MMHSMKQNRRLNFYCTLGVYEVGRLESLLCHKTVNPTKIMFFFPPLKEIIPEIKSPLKSTLYNSTVHRTRNPRAKNTVPV